jgi:hypothetical protein
MRAAGSCIDLPRSLTRALATWSTPSTIAPSPSRRAGAAASARSQAVIEGIKSIRFGRPTLSSTR